MQFLFNMPNYTNAIIGIVIALLMAGILLPIGLTEILAVNTTNTTINTLVTTLMPVMAVIAIVMLFVSARSNKHTM